MQPFAVAHFVASSCSHGVGVPEQPVGVPVPVLEVAPEVVAPLLDAVLEPLVVDVLASPPVPDAEAESEVAEVVAAPEVEVAPPSPPAPTVTFEPGAPAEPPVPKRSSEAVLLHAATACIPSSNAPKASASCETNVTGS